MITTCKNCETNNITHDFQDTNYGKFKRVFNESGNEKSGSKCTVCGIKTKPNSK